jgi:hypothetical protein
MGPDQDRVNGCLATQLGCVGTTSIPPNQDLRIGLLGGGSTPQLASLLPNDEMYPSENECTGTLGRTWPAAATNRGAPIAVPGDYPARLLAPMRMAPSKLDWHQTLPNSPRKRSASTARLIQRYNLSRWR